MAIFYGYGKLPEGNYCELVFSLVSNLWFCKMSGFWLVSGEVMHRAGELMYSELPVRHAGREKCFLVHGWFILICTLQWQSMTVYGMLPTWGIIRLSTSLILVNIRSPSKLSSIEILKALFRAVECRSTTGFQVNPLQIFK